MLEAVEAVDIHTPVVDATGEPLDMDDKPGNKLAVDTFGYVPHSKYVHIVSLNIEYIDTFHE